MFDWARLGETKIKLLEEIDGLKLQCKMLKHNRAEVVIKIIPYIAMDIYHSDEVRSIVGNLVKASIFHGRCKALEEVVETKKLMDLSKVLCYRATIKMEYEEVDNAYVTADYPFLIEATKDPSSTIEMLLSKKPYKLKPPSPSKKSSPLNSPSTSKKPDSPTKE
ncbi:hypothetical protein Tco_1524899 [Tanacetum coccineum]